MKAAALLVATGLEIIEWLLLLMLLLLGVDHSGTDRGTPRGSAYSCDIGTTTGTLTAGQGCCGR